MAHCVLETREARVVPVIDLAFVIDHCKELVIVQSLWAWISTRKRGSTPDRWLAGWLAPSRTTYVPLPSRAAVVYDAIFIDTGTRTGVSILYVSNPRCSKRCPQTHHQQNNFRILLH